MKENQTARTFLLDTCVIINAAEEGGLKRMSRRVRAILEEENNSLLISSVSISEIAIKTAIKKLDIPEPVLAKIIDDLGLDYLPYFPRHARRLYDLPLHHREPFDRMLIAVAIADGLPILTTDREFENYRDVGLQVIS